MESAISDATRLEYCTTGVLLRRLQSDPNLTGITHVVIDEVHGDRVLVIRPLCLMMF